MPTKLLLKFAMPIERYDIKTRDRHGPLFHRWLPDGKSDAVVFENNQEGFIIRFWFEQYGFVEGGMIKFDYNRREVNREIITKQAVLDAGPLHGLLEVHQCADEVVLPIQESSVSDTHYIAFAKKVVTRIIYPEITRFLEIIKTNFGQYWIEPLDKWDSRKYSLGYYCSLLNLKWSLDDGENWSPFFPAPSPVVSMVEVLLGLSSSYWRDYLTKNDWKQLNEAYNNRYAPTLAARLLARAHEIYDQGNVRHALIEGITTLEVTIGEFLRSKLEGDKELASAMQSFWSLPLSAQIVTVASIHGHIDLQDIKLVNRAIELRNKIAHEGEGNIKDADGIIQGLLRTIGRLLPGPEFKFPSANKGNAIRPVEEWEKSP